MKTIQNPNIWKLGISLIPIPILFAYVMVIKDFPVWVFVAGIISTVVYMALVTYYCVKQKCYAQLLQNYLVLIVWAIIFTVQFYYVDKLVAHLH